MKTQSFKDWPTVISPLCLTALLALGAGIALALFLATFDVSLLALVLLFSVGGIWQAILYVQTTQKSAAKRAH